MIQNLSGQKLGQYEVRERLGRGGMADVYKAFQPALQRFVAIKVMQEHLAADEGFIRRFEREAQTVAQLSHPHIVGIIDFGTERNMHYMVMQFIQGANLKALIAAHPEGLPINDALRTASQVADALNYAHRKGMVHRDIKPDNIMFMDETYQQAMLTDFGVARILSLSSLPSTGLMIGTPAYLAPEIITGRDADERSDLYSLGVVLFEMLTGRTPYAADTPMAVLLKHVNAPLPSLSEYGRELPEMVETILLKALIKNPDERYQTAADMKTALDNVQTRLANPLSAQKPLEPLRISSEQEKIQQTAADVKKILNNRIFISYKRLDWEKFVQPLVARLQTHGLSYWVDQRLIEGGDDWMDEINRALKECDTMILCISPEALESRHVKMEYRYFFNHGKPIYPLICELPVELPAELQIIQHYRYDELDALLQQLKSKL